jgi:membrane-bound serine protease (ClpP class)
MGSPRFTRTRRFAPRALLGLVLAAALGAPTPSAAQTRQHVQVIPIEGMIDMGLAPFVRRVLADAERDGAAAVILDINTFGGRLDAAVAIRDALLSSPVRSVAWVNRRAISAGALISLAAVRIVMTDGGTIGAATPVQIGGGDGQAKPVEEKSVSYVRKEFRATADSRNRPPDIAEAMVDDDVEIPGLIEKDKLLTLTTDEALERGVADARANTLEEVLAQLDLSDAEVRTSSPNWGERFVRLITSPVLASLLLSAAVIGILVEIRTPGFGVPGALGVASLALVLGGHYVVELVGWEELILVTIGLGLIALEVFVIPGFGIAGIGGAIAVIAGLSLSLVGHGATVNAVMGAIGRISISVAMGLVLSLVIFRSLAKAPVGRRLILESALPAGGGEDEPVEHPRHAMLGRTGVTRTPLRPAGIAEIDGERMDVVSNGEMIDTGVTVVVTRLDGNRIVVRAHSAAAHDTSTQHENAQ